MFPDVVVFIQVELRLMLSHMINLSNADQLKVLLDGLLSMVVRELLLKHRDSLLKSGSVDAVLVHLEQLFLFLDLSLEE